jgi:hypothetical protein
MLKASAAHDTGLTPDAGKRRNFLTRAPVDLALALFRTMHLTTPVERRIASTRHQRDKLTLDGLPRASRLAADSRSRVRWLPTWRSRAPSAAPDCRCACTHYLVFKEPDNPDTLAPTSAAYAAGIPSSDFLGFRGTL